MKNSILRQIEKEYGDVDSFVSKAKEWLRKLPREYLDHNKDLKALRDKTPDWNNSTTLAIVNRKMTSIEHVEWVNSVLDRIDRMEDRVGNASLPPVTTRSSMEEKMRKRFRKDKDSALQFMNSVRGYVQRNLKITEDQMETLNEIYERYEKLTQTSWT